MNLKDKTVLITGGTKGIGLSTAHRLVKEGMRVMITGTSQESVNAAVRSFPEDYKNRVLAMVADVVSMPQMRAVADNMVMHWGKIDVLVANAGVGYFASIDEMTEEQWKEVIDINLTGVFNSVKSTVDQLKDSQGYIFTIASLAGTNFFAKGAAYNASKFGLVGFTQAIMLDLRDYGVKCTTIMPGSVSTFFNGNVPSDKDAWKIQPEDIAQLIADLLKMPERALPSKVEIRPSQPPKK